MEAAISDQLAALGRSKVLITLQPDSLEAVTPGSGQSEPGSKFHALEAHFVAADEQQSHALDLAAAHFAGKTRSGRSAPRPKVRVFPRLGLALGLVDAEGAEALQRDPTVSRVHAAPELSLIRPVEVAPARASPSPTWGLQRLRVPTLWQHGIDGRGVVIGHLDTGVDAGHPALANAVAAFAEFDLAGYAIRGSRAHDTALHGTHTAGTLVGRRTDRGAFGVAGQAKLASALVIEGGQAVDRVLAGLEWIVEQNVRILSMSLGLRGYTPAFEELINALRRNNVLPVIAIGNEGPDTSRSPGNYGSSVLSIGACVADDAVADFSSSQRFARAEDPLVPDLVAPGVDVLSCVPGGKFARMNGTSMATPHVAGLAALLLQAHPGASAADLEAAILASCQRPSAMPPSRANRGVPDAVQALKVLTGRDLTDGSMAAATAFAAPDRRRRRSAATTGRAMLA